MATDDDIINKAIAASADIYTDPRIRRFERELEQRHAGRNHVFQGDLDGIGRVRYLVSHQSPRGDWALSKSGLLYFRTALEESKIIAGMVVLWERNGNANAAPVEAVWDKVKDAYWYHGDGEYTWVDNNFTPAMNSSGSGSRYYITDPDGEPF